jgi:hypothetical protein
MTSNPETLLTGAPFIPHRRFMELSNEIARCQRMTARCGEPYCMSLEGATGAGKTRLAKSYLNQHPPYETEQGIMRPVFYMVTPAETTVKGLAEQMLFALGDPAAHKGTGTQMDSRLDHLIGACGVDLIILDDFHHLLNISTERRLKAVSDWLKVRIKNTGKTFLIVGIEGEIAKVLTYSPQLARLFAARTTLEPFPWDPTQPDPIVEFDLFVRLAESALNIQLPTSVPRIELLYRLHYATAGLVGNIVTLLRYTALLAEEQVIQAVTLPLLANAFDHSLRDYLHLAHNPFDTSHGPRFGSV